MLANIASWLARRVDLFLDEESQALAMLSDFIGKSVSLQSSRAIRPGAVRHRADVTPNPQRRQKMKTEPEFDSLVPPQTFNRRSFLVTSLGAGFAIATQPVMAQTAIKTDEVGLIAGEIQVPVRMARWSPIAPCPAGLLTAGGAGGVKSSARMNTSAIPAAAWPSSVIAPSRRICSPARAIRGRLPAFRKSSKNHQQDARCPGDERSRCLCCLGCQQRCRYCAGSNRILLGRPHRLVVLHPTIRGEGRRRLVSGWWARSTTLRLDIRPIWSVNSGAGAWLYGGLDTGIPLETVEAMEKACSKAGAATKASEIQPTRRMPSMPITAPATARKRPRDGWKRMLAWFRKTACKPPFRGRKGPFVLTFAPRPEPVSSRRPQKPPPKNRRSACPAQGSATRFDVFRNFSPLAIGIDKQVFAQLPEVNKKSLRLAMRNSPCRRVT